MASRYPAIRDLPEVLAQIVHFSRNDYISGMYPEDVGWNAAYTCACFLAQHTRFGVEGCDTEGVYEGLNVMAEMPFDTRLAIARELVDAWNGVK